MHRVVAFFSLVVLFSMASFSDPLSFRARLLTCKTYHGYNLNFFYTTQAKDGHFRCHDTLGNEYFLRFDGAGIGLGLAAKEGFIALYQGLGDPIGSYYGVRAEAAALVGANAMVAFKAHKSGVGMLKMIGIDLGALGFDTSLIKIKIVSEDNQDKILRNKN